MKNTKFAKKAMINGAFFVFCGLAAMWIVRVSLIISDMNGRGRTAALTNIVRSEVIGY